MALSDELAQRRLAQFEARHGARLVEFAAAAALPVVLDPRLVHLVRINFFVDGDPPLPWTAESDLLFSPLCTELDDGLFEIEPTTRGILLGRLQRDGGPVRIRDIASLLWAYLHQRPAPWAHEPGLERAQELTALQVLDPHACEVWLERAQAAVDRDVRAERPWFVAIQRKLQPWRDLLDQRDLARALRARLDAIMAECVALRSLDFLADVQPPLRQEIDAALARLEGVEKLARGLRENLSDDNLVARPEVVDSTQALVVESRLALLYSALLRLPFEPVVRKARESGWGQRKISQVVLSGGDGLAHRWLAARLYEERSRSGDSAVFVIRNSTGSGWVERIRSFLRQNQQEIVLQLDSFDAGAVEQWVMLLLEKVGRTLPEFVWNADDSREQILFKLAGWLGLDTESLSRRLARVPVRGDEAVVPPTRPAQPAGHDVDAPPGRNVFAAIGIGRYRHWRSLRNPVEDAVRVAAVFQKLGFELAARLLDECATREAMYRLVTDDLAALGPEDSLVLFYAGHGATIERRLDEHVIRNGYLIPADAQNKEAVVSWVDLESWLRMISMLPAKHILVILDACGTGVSLDPVLRWRSAVSNDSPIHMLRARRSRRVITSGLCDEELFDEGPVPGCSLFAGCLIEALDGGLASGPDGAPYVTGSELALYVQRRVRAHPNSRQTPDFGAFNYDDRGELVIPLLHAPASS